MSKRFITNLLSRHKLLSVAFVLVLVPLLFLSYIQFLSIVELERKTKDAHNENLRLILVDIKGEIETRLEKTYEGISTLVNNIEASSPINEGKIKTYLAKVKDTYPEVKNVLLVSCANVKCNFEDDFGYMYSDALRRINVSISEHQDDNAEYVSCEKKLEYHTLVHAYKRSIQRKNFIDKNHRVSFMPWQHLKCTSKEVYIFSALRGMIGTKPTSFVAVTVNKEYIERTLLSKIRDDKLKDSTLRVSDSDIRARLTERIENSSSQSSQLTKSDYIHEISLSSPFNNWVLEIGFEKTDIESIARTAFWKNFFITLLTLIFLVLGLVLTIRATTREIRLAQAKSDFVSNVSHELKTPLSLIRLFIEILELGYVQSSEKKREYYRIINDESLRLSQLIDNILDFSTIESGHQVYNFESHDIGGIVPEVISRYGHHMDEVGFELNTITEENLPAINVDRDAISQALINLIDNSIKYSTEVKEIMIEVKKRNSRLLIEVTDKGQGIAKRYHKKIFDKFFRVTAGLVHDVKGNGLGLALVKHIVEAHHGKITVESELKKGSRFIISLPIDVTPHARKNDQSLIQGGH